MSAQSEGATVVRPRCVANQVCLCEMQRKLQPFCPATVMSLIFRRVVRVSRYLQSMLDRHEFKRKMGGGRDRRSVERTILGDDLHMRHLRGMGLVLVLVAPSSWGQEPPKQDGKTAAQWAKDLQSKDSFEREKAAGALAKLGPGAKDAVPALVKALADPDEDVRRRIPYALGKIGPAAKDAVPALIARLKDESGEVRYWCVLALGQIAPEADGVFGAAKSMVKDPKVGPAAVTTLGLIKSKTKEVLPILGEALSDEALRPYVTTVLGKMGPVALPTLTLLLKSEDEDARTQALAALGLVGKEAVPLLADALKDKSARMRLNAAASLARMGPEAKGAMKELIAALKDERREIRLRAVEALGNIGPAAKDAFSALEDAESDLDADVRMAAREAMKKIQK
jgi:HEAT repeat protein